VHPHGAHAGAPFFAHSDMSHCQRFWTMSHVTLSTCQKMCAPACATCGCTHFRTLYPKSRCTRMGHMRVHPFLRTVTCHIVNFFGQCHMSHCQCVKKCVPLPVPLADVPAFGTMCHKLRALACGTCRCTFFWTMCQKWCAAACATSRRTCFWSPF
jgi:hypothetical protein